MNNYLFRLPVESGRTLQVQIRQMLVDAILDGHIPLGSPLPSSRRLAEQLNVARNTVVLAYQQLVDEGYLISRERSGYYVCDDLFDNRASVNAQPRQRGEVVDWNAHLKRRPSEQANITKPQNWRDYPYPFIYGQLDPGLFPVNDWRECSRGSVHRATIFDWSIDRFDRDDPELVKQIHTRLLPRRGVFVDPSEILVTVGAQHALYLVAELLMHEASTVGMEDPGYPDARNIFNSHAGTVKPISVDDHGLEVDAGQIDDCHSVYVTPSHQSPTGVTMPLARREKLLQIAREKNIIVIEDDYESELNYSGQPTPALKSLDNDERVIYVGSLSKTLAPGLRMGYLAASREFIREARALRRLMLRHPPSNNQFTVAEFLRLGHHDSLVRRLSIVYRERWDLLGKALATHLPDSYRVPGFGGTSFWVTGPDTLDTRALAPVAAEHGILIEPGDIYFNHGQRSNCMRLGFSSISTEAIEPGIALLAKLMADT